MGTKDVSMQIETTNHYDVAEIKGKSVTDHQ